MEELFDKLMCFLGKLFAAFIFLWIGLFAFYIASCFTVHQHLGITTNFIYLSLFGAILLTIMLISLVLGFRIIDHCEKAFHSYTSTDKGAL